MELQVIELEDKIILRDIEDFEAKDIFECGQAFRWQKEEDGSYTTVAYGRFLNVRREGSDIVLSPTNREDFDQIWYRYFDLATDYSRIKEELSGDKILSQATAYGQGIRILNQEPFETIISFIISANNQIPRIKKSVEILAREYGDFIGNYRGRDYYSFPGPEVLARLSPQELREKARVGFRDKRIVDTAQMIEGGQVDLAGIFEMTKDEGKKELQKLAGVGPKVADCCLLFAFEKGDAFPVDTWVKRVMEHFYLEEETSLKKIGDKGHELFGQLAGYAQQYLFYYAREEEIGK